MKYPGRTKTSTTASDPEWAASNSVCSPEGRLKHKLTNPFGKRVPSSGKVSYKGSCSQNGMAEGAKNIWKKSGCHTKMDIATYNIKSMATEDRTEELGAQVGKTKWDVIGISETRERGEGYTKLTSGHKLYYKGRKTQAYAEDEEVSKFYEEISEGMRNNKTSQVLVIGNFNCKIRGQAEREEKYVGKHRLGKRNPRGSMIVDFLEEEHLYNANTFFQKKPNRKWIWAIPDGRTFNQIDYILTKNIHIVQNVENTPKQIKSPEKMAKEDIRKHNVRIAQKVLEQHKGTKVFRRLATNTKKEIVRIKDKTGPRIEGRHEIIRTVQEYYADLYETRVRSDISEQDQEVKVTNVISEDIPEITEDEIRSALHHMKNGKASGKDGILTEMLKQGGDILVEQLKILSNKCLENEDIPQD
ncbi:hypothetical protein HUJ05_008739 [Dendroctonus ponderosae]|nr:hypothetical protein HUJ05_008739 [Dendroctonus ponderosae]